MDNFSLSDLKAVVDNNEGGFGGGSWWIILLFIILFGNSGFFGGNRNQGDIAPVLNNDFSILERKLDGISNGVCQSSYENARLANQTEVSVLQGFNDTQRQFADCCCATQRAIDGVRYDGAQHTFELANTVHQDGEATRAAIAALSAKMDQNEIQQLRDRLYSAELNSSLCGVVRYPLATTYKAGCPPCFNNGCGCGTNF